MARVRLSRCLQLALEAFRFVGKGEGQTVCVPVEPNADNVGARDARILRVLLDDRNWVVVRQEPPAGTKVNDDTTITLHAKKEGE